METCCASLLFINKFYAEFMYNAALLEKNKIPLWYENSLYVIFHSSITSKDLEPLKRTLLITLIIRIPTRRHRNRPYHRPQHQSRQSKTMTSTKCCQQRERRGNRRKRGRVAIRTRRRRRGIGKARNLTSTWLIRRIRFLQCHRHP